MSAPQTLKLPPPKLTILATCLLQWRLFDPLQLCSCQGLGMAGSGGGVSWPPKIWSWSQKLQVALMSDRCKSNGNDH